MYLLKQNQFYTRIAILVQYKCCVVLRFIKLLRRVIRFLRLPPLCFAGAGGALLPKILAMKDVFWGG
jgi:hypothetical protein